MNKFLIRIFVKNHEDVKNPKVRENYGKFAGVVGIVSNVILCAMKIIIGLISSSIAIIADGINNLADASSSVITLIGFKLSAMPEDKDHPYGHARYEYLTGMIVSILIILLGIQLLRTSVDKVIHPDPLAFSYVTVIVLVLAIAIKIWQAVFNISIGKKINSVALIATGTDSRNDVIATSAVLIGVLIGKFFGIQLDGIMGCLVAVFIIWSGIQLVRETTSPLLGEAPDPELVREISEISLKTEGVLGIHDLAVHNYGPGKIFASVHVEVDSDVDIMESHDMVDNLEKELQNRLNIHVTIHMDPVKCNDPLTEDLKQVIAKVIHDMPGVESFHDLRIVPGPTHTNIIFDIVIAPECKLETDDIKEILTQKLREKDPKFRTVIDFDQAYIG